MDKNSAISWHLFKKAINRELSSEEEVLFSEWLLSDKKNEEYYNRACNYYKNFDYEVLKKEEEFDTAWREFLNHTQGRKVFISRWSKIAAVFIILIGLSIIFYSSIHKWNVIHIAESPIKPGKTSARLFLNDGGVISLGDADTIVTFKEHNSTLKINSSSIEYLNTGIYKTSEVPKNIIETPTGGEFKVTLSDGTEVWLNSESRLEYPVQFSSGIREVFLSGEAYFEVTKNTECPFIVNVGEIRIKVLGTSFNINSYDDDPNQVMTLITGSIEVGGLKGIGDTSVILEPNEQLVFNNKTWNVEIRNVDPAIFTSWTQGSFIFESETMTNIFKKLARWYDIEVVFANSVVENELFSGRLPRFENLDVLLDLIEKVSATNITVDGKKVVIK